MIKYAIPGMYELKELNFKLLDLKKTSPFYFYENVDIEICYGNFQFCIWDGGRIFNEYVQTNKEEIEQVLNIYNNIFNIPVRYVFTNNSLNEIHYKNRFCNLIMQLSDNKNNEVVLSDENLLDYLHQNYPSFQFVSSTTKCLSNKQNALEEINKEKFKLVCLDYNLNSNIDFLKTLSQEQKDKVEFLINPICPLGCQNRKNHYYLNSQSHLNYGKKYGMESCLIKENGLHPNTINRSHITYEMIKNIYEPLGFSHFKIEGRTWDRLSLCLTYCNYMIKPEFHNTVISLLMQDK